MLYLARREGRFLLGNFSGEEFKENYACASQNDKFIFYAKKNKIFKLCKITRQRSELHTFKHPINHMYTDNHIIAVNSGDKQVLFDFNFKEIISAEFPNIVHEIYAMHNKLVIASENFLKIYPKNIIYERCGQFCYVDQYLYTSYECSLFAFCHLELILVIKIEEKIKEFAVKNNCCIFYTEKNNLLIYDLMEKILLEKFESVKYFSVNSENLIYFTSELKKIPLKISERKFFIREKKEYVKKVLEDFKEDEDNILPAGRTYKKRKKVVFETDDDLMNLFNEDRKIEQEYEQSNEEVIVKKQQQPRHVLFFNMSGMLIYFNNIIRFQNISIRMEKVLDGCFFADNIILRTPNGSYFYTKNTERKKFHAISNFDFIYEKWIFRSTDENLLIYNIETEQEEYLNITKVHSVAVAKNKFYICCVCRTVLYFNEKITEMDFQADLIFYSESNNMIYYLTGSQVFQFDGVNSTFLKEVRIRDGYECAIIIQDYLIAVDRSDLKCKRQYIKLKN